MTPSTISRKLLRCLIPPAFWLGVWQLAAAAADEHGRRLVLPGPAQVLSTLGRLARTEEFWRITAATLVRILAGLGVGAALGVLLAVLTKRFRMAELLLSPAIRVIRATPVASFIILVFLWVESGRVPGVMSALMVLPVVWGNVAAGIGETDPLLLEMAACYRFSRWKTLRLVYIPAVLPYFASGLKTALGLAWKAGVAAEVLCVPKRAIGSQVYYSKLYLETPDLFAWTLVVIGLSLALEWGLGALLGRLGRRNSRRD